MDEAGNVSDAEAVEYWMKWRNHDPESPVQGYRGWDSFQNQTIAFESTNSSAGFRPAWSSFFPDSRADMFMLFDNGWASADHITVNASKYPMFGNGTALERLSNMSAHVRSLGWRGLGLWIPGPAAATATTLEMLQQARVGLLKVDGGDPDCEVTALARMHAPDVYIECVACPS